MSSVIVTLLVVSAVIAAVAKLMGQRHHVSSEYRYITTPLFNATEHQFFLALRSAAPSNIAVLAKVRVADLLLPKTENIAAFNRIARKHIDFVLYNTQSRKVVRVIELDGPTHTSARAQKNDKIKNSCFESAGLLLTRIDAMNWNSAGQLRALFTDERDQHISQSLPAKAQGNVTSHPGQNGGRQRRST